jgi:hypothetical protein
MKGNLLLLHIECIIIDFIELLFVSVGELQFLMQYNIKNVLTSITQYKEEYKMVKKIKCLFFAVAALLLLPSTNGYSYDAGWEAVNMYHGTNPELYECVDEGIKFRDAVNSYGGGSGWNVAYGWSNDAAWERDFKDQAIGGTDNIYVDNIDLALFAGHGSPSGFYFGVPVDDYVLTYNDATWGDKDLEWIILDACQTLRRSGSAPFNTWGGAFEGLHYIFGYHTTTGDVDTRGRDFVRYAMYYGQTVRSAWINATIASENGTTAAYLRATKSGADTYNDHLWGFGSVASDPTSPKSLAYSNWGT